MYGANETRYQVTLCVFALFAPPGIKREYRHYVREKPIIKDGVDAQRSWDVHQDEGFQISKNTVVRSELERD